MAIHAIDPCLRRSAHILLATRRRHGWGNKDPEQRERDQGSFHTDLLNCCRFAERRRSPAGASNASPGPVKRLVRRPRHQPGQDLYPLSITISQTTRSESASTSDVGGSTFAIRPS